jgi:hypothetical protein
LYGTPALLLTFIHPSTQKGIGEAAADNLCKPTGKKCNKDKQCCSVNCVNGTCAACPSGQVLCNGSCVSNSCPTGQTFNSSTCQCECPSGQVLCNGSCVSNNCGPVGTLNPNTCTRECSDPNNPFHCVNNPDPNLQKCCPTLFGTMCVPLGTVCSPPG